MKDHGFFFVRFYINLHSRRWRWPKISAPGLEKSCRSTAPAHRIRIRSDTGTGTWSQLHCNYAYVSDKVILPLAGVEGVESVPVQAGCQHFSASAALLNHDPLEEGKVLLAEHVEEDLGRILQLHRHVHHEN
jgi:hypothetical protein